MYTYQHCVFNIFICSHWWEYILTINSFQYCSNDLRKPLTQYRIVSITWQIYVATYTMQWCISIPVEYILIRQGSVSLPADVSDSPALADLAPSSTLEKTESLECMLRPTSEVVALDDSLGVVTPYMDPVLGGDRQMYIDFLEDLDSRGLLSWSQQPKVLCSVFFLWIRSPPQRRGQISEWSSTVALPIGLSKKLPIQF